jgi:hypothetical protein
VAQRLIVGIFPDSDGAAIESALTSAQIDPGQATVVRRAGAAGDDETSTELQFVDVVLEEEVNSYADDMTKGMGIIGDGGGTSVPMGRDSSPSAFATRTGGAGYFANSGIPDDEIDNFNDAVSDGRAVVLYRGADDAEATAAALRAAGLRNVRIY